MCYNETMRLEIGLYRYYNFFEQGLNLSKYKQGTRNLPTPISRQVTRHRIVMNKLTFSFYQTQDVVQIAKELLGKILVTNWEGIITSGRIVECEAYAGVIDKASHASGGRRTARNEIMYGEGGYAYVYLCYGIHYLFNVITNKDWIRLLPLVLEMSPKRWEFLPNTRALHYWAKKFLSGMMGKNLAKRKLPLHRVLVSITPVKMRYCLIVFT